MQLSTQISFCRVALQPLVPLSISKALFLSSKPVLSSHNFKRLIKRDFLLVNPSNLGVHRELGGDTARTADPNWPKGCPIACGAMWDNNTGGVGGRGHSCWATRWASVGLWSPVALCITCFVCSCYCFFFFFPLSLFLFKLSWSQPFFVTFSPHFPLSRGRARDWCGKV